MISTILWCDCIIVFSVAETVLCRLSHGVDVPPPEVATEEEIRRLAEYVSARYTKLFGLSRDNMKMSQGVLLRKMVDHMSNLENEFVIYSGHDGTILRLLVSLANGKDFQFPWPSYSANLIFECWERKKENDVNEEDMGWKQRIHDWINGTDRGRGKFIRILYEGNVLHLNDREFVPIEVFEEMWSDIMIEPSVYWHRECLC